MRVALTVRHSPRVLALRALPRSHPRLFSSTPPPQFDASTPSQQLKITCDVSETPQSGKVPDSERRAKRRYISDLMQLTKARLSGTVAFTAWGFFYVTSPAPLLVWPLSPEWAQVFAESMIVFSGTFLAACSSAVANQMLEVKQDGAMARTRLVRPLPSGRMTIGRAAQICAITGISGHALLLLLPGYTPALVSAATWALYVLVYTPLKMRTRWNTEVGAVVGALPTLVGVSAALPSSGFPTMSELIDLIGSLHGVLGVSILYFWQMYHFMLVCSQHADSYASAGFVMQSTAVSIPR